MKRIFIIFTLLSSTQLYAAPYETAVRFSEGDVISADVLNDILDRIELSLKDIERSEMIGNWNISSHLCSSGRPGIDVNEERGEGTCRGLPAALKCGVFFSCLVPLISHSHSIPPH